MHITILVKPPVTVRMTSVPHGKEMKPDRSYQIAGRQRLAAEVSLQCYCNLLWAHTGKNDAGYISFLKLFLLYFQLTIKLDSKKYKVTV
jgi:hypothetical protein